MKDIENREREEKTKRRKTKIKRRPVDEAVGREGKEGQHGASLLFTLDAAPHGPLLRSVLSRLALFSLACNVQLQFDLSMVLGDHVKVLQFRKCSVHPAMRQP